jgi:hypothetical protein
MDAAGAMFYNTISFTLPVVSLNDLSDDDRTQLEGNVAEAVSATTGVAVDEMDGVSLKAGSTVARCSF